MESLLVFDVRHLSHPEPLEIMTKALLQARKNKVLKMIHRREPFPLYDIILAGNLAYKTFKQNEEIYIIYIGKQNILESFLDSEDLSDLIPIIKS